MFSGKNARGIYCSTLCKERANHPLRPKKTNTCAYCGNIFQSINKANIRTCSKECGWKLQNKIHAQQRKEERHRRWAESERKCQLCHGEISVDKRIGTLYCSRTCKSNALAARWREKAPHYMRQYIYGLSAEAFETLLVTQNHACAICGVAFGKDKVTGPNVDHAHTTSQVRGLLCAFCNRGLGSFRDDPVRLRLAIEYLKKAG